MAKSIHFDIDTKPKPVLTPFFWQWRFTSSHVEHPHNKPNNFFLKTGKILIHRVTIHSKAKQIFNNTNYKMNK